jgi:hypothetical protein
MGQRGPRTLVGTVALLVLLGQPASAITGGGPAPEGAPYEAVGALLLRYVSTGDGSEYHVGFCSGTYVDAEGPHGYEHAFLTAAHCTFDIDTYPLSLLPLVERVVDAEVDYAGLQVTFEPEPWGDEPLRLADDATTIDVEVDDDAVVQTLGHAQRPGRRDDGDVALLSLDAAPDADPVAVDTSTLTSSTRNELRAATWVSVGYGAIYDRARGPSTIEPGGDRWSSTAPGGFLALRPGYLYLSQNQARGHGGTCYGDSGGPIFLELEGKLHLVAVTSWGDAPCKAANFAYRLDTPTSLAVLGSP